MADKSFALIVSSRPDSAGLSRTLHCTCLIGSETSENCRFEFLSQQAGIKSLVSTDLMQKSLILMAGKILEVSFLTEEKFVKMCGCHMNDQREERLLSNI